jgi:hypothetical protein
MPAYHCTDATRTQVVIECFTSEKEATELSLVVVGVPKALVRLLARVEALGGRVHEGDAKKVVRPTIYDGKDL